MKVIEKNKILLADCMDIMAQMPDKFVDLALVDPPYGKGDVSNINTWNKKIYPNKQNKHKPAKWNVSRPTKKYFNELIRISKNQIIWGGKLFCRLTPNVKWVDILGQNNRKHI